MYLLRHDTNLGTVLVGLLLCGVLGLTGLALLGSTVEPVVLEWAGAAEVAGERAPVEVPADLVIGAHCAKHKDEPLNAWTLYEALVASVDYWVGKIGSNWEVCD